MVVGAALSVMAAVTAPASAQSLWSARAGSLVTDIKASRAGDIITILVDEQSTAEKKAETKLDRDSSIARNVSVPDLKPDALRDFLEMFNVDASGKSNYNGKGTTTRTDRATTVIAARIMRVMDNGNLLIEGRRLVVLQNETQALVVTGLIRPVDILPDNTVRSSQIADAEVRIEGQGAISQRQRPGLLHRVFDWLGLF
jgi:flagellar L-ring protein precursor FlgH